MDSLANDRPTPIEDERDYEAKAAQREEERLRKEEAMKKEAIAKAISGASGQVRKCWVPTAVSCCLPVDTAVAYNVAAPFEEAQRTNGSSA